MCVWKRWEDLLPVVKAEKKRISLALPKNFDVTASWIAGNVQKLSALYRRLYLFRKP